MQAALQGPRQNFRLPAADFKQAVLDAQSGAGSSATGLKIRLPISKGGPASKPRGSGSTSRPKSSGQVRSAEQLCTMIFGVHKDYGDSSENKHLENTPKTLKLFRMTVVIIQVKSNERVCNGIDIKFASYSE